MGGRGGGGGGRKGSVSRGISNAVINRKSKRVKRAGREIKSDGRTACIVHGCISAPWKPARHNCELRWSRTGIYLFAAARSLFMTKMHQRPVSAPPPHPTLVFPAIEYRWRADILSEFSKTVEATRLAIPSSPPSPLLPFSFFGTIVRSWIRRFFLEFDDCWNGGFWESRVFYFN